MHVSTSAGRARQAAALAGVGYVLSHINLDLGAGGCAYVCGGVSFGIGRHGSFSVTTGAGVDLHGYLSAGVSYNKSDGASMGAACGVASGPGLYGEVGVGGLDNAGYGGVGVSVGAGAGCSAQGAWTIPL